MRPVGRVAELGSLGHTTRIANMGAAYFIVLERKIDGMDTGMDGKIYHAAMKLGSGLIMMGCPESGYRNPKRLGQATQSLYINVKDVDKHFQRAQKAGAIIIEEPTDTEYGHRRYRVTDPEGHEWCFAQDIRRQKPKRKTRDNRK